MTQALLERLARRGERVTVAAVPWVAPVYQAMPHVENTVVLPFTRGALQWSARRAFAKSLAGQFQTAYVCPNSFKSALIPWFAGIPRRVGYRGEMRFGLLTDALPNPNRNQQNSMVSFYSALSGESVLLEESPSLALDAALSAQTWRKFHLEPQAYFVFAPGAEYGPAKRWPISHFASLARSLRLPIVLLGSGKDSGICEEILHQTRAETAQSIASGLVLNLAGKTSLIEAFSIIAGAKAVVSNDSGLMHVAAALGVRQVALFGSSSPLHTPPRNTLAEVIWLKSDPNYQPALNCAPCFERLCPLGHTRCLVDIQPELVRTRLNALLE